MQLRRGDDPAMRGCLANVRSTNQGLCRITGPRTDVADSTRAQFQAWNGSGNVTIGNGRVFLECGGPVEVGVSNGVTTARLSQRFGFIQLHVVGSFHAGEPGGRDFTSRRTYLFDSNLNVLAFSDRFPGTGVPAQDWATRFVVVGRARVRIAGTVLVLRDGALVPQ